MRSRSDSMMSSVESSVVDLEHNRTAACESVASVVVELPLVENNADSNKEDDAYTNYTVNNSASHRKNNNNAKHLNAVSSTSLLLTFLSDSIAVTTALATNSLLQVI